MTAPRVEHKIFWTVLAAISLILAIRNRSRLTFPPHITILFVYLAFAGASVSWAFKPEYSFLRIVQQAMIVTSIVLPSLLAARTADMMGGLFLCFTFALVMNLFFVLNQSPLIFENGREAYIGYFTFKGILGECAAIALLLSLLPISYPGWRRVLGVAVFCLAIYLMIISDSRGSLGLAILAPLLAGLTLFIGKRIGVSPAMVLFPIPVCYAVLSRIVGNLVNRISWYLYGNYDLSGRAYIWDFANFEIARKPLLGWGYQSFWLVGPDAPSKVDASGWIRNMPSSHNGYLDTMVDLGYVGLALLVIFIFATLHAIGRVAARDPAPAWVLLSLGLYVILTNFIETGWMHGMDMLWLIFLIAAAEAGRYWEPMPARASELLNPRSVIAGRRLGLVQGQGIDKVGLLQKRRK